MRRNCFAISRYSTFLKKERLQGNIHFIDLKHKKGVAKVTIKSKVLKKLKAGKKVKYQVTYKKDTVKKTVKVKK